MKLTIRVSLAVLVVALVVGAASAQSLGEAARQARKKKSAPSPAQKVYTNDNLPTNAPISIMSGSGVEGQSASDKKSDERSSNTTGTQAAAPDDKKKEYEELRARVAEQKNKIQLLEREMDVLQREHQVQVSVFYADAGTRLRDDRRWADQDRKYKTDVEEKQRQIAGAKQQLEDMREQARKAGIPASVVD